MSFRLYKEGQGIWARGALAFILFVTGLFAAVRCFGWLEAEDYLSGAFTIPLLNWDIGLRHLMAVVILAPFMVVGIWLYNKAKLADFLIETEGELKNKVTWPTKKEATNNSIVVVVTCILLGVWISLADVVFSRVKDLIYGMN